MEHARPDLLGGVLNSGWAQPEASQAQQSNKTAGSWGGDTSGYEAANLRENDRSSTRQHPNHNIQAAKQQVNQINAHIGTSHSSRSQHILRVKSEPASEEFNMQSITIYQPAGTQAAPSSEPERVVPVYRPHLGPRSQFEKKYGLPPGGSYTAGRKPNAQVQVAEVKQEVVNEAKREVKQEGDALRDISNGQSQYATQHQATSYASPVPTPAEEESSWHKANHWSHSQQQAQRLSPQQSQVPSHPVKEEANAPPNLTITVQHQTQTHANAIFSPKTPNGLSASRYASNTHPQPHHTAPRVSRNEATTDRQANRNTPQHVYGGQALADPTAFMSAVNGGAGDKQQTPQAPASSSMPQAQPTAVNKPSPPPPTAPAEGKDIEYSDEVYADFLGTKAYGNRYQSSPTQQSPPKYQSPSDWPEFPSSIPNKEMGSAARWGTDPTVSVAMASPNDLPQPIPAPAAQQNSAKHAQATTAWKNFASSENKKNKEPMEAVKFVPATSGWPDDDPPTPSPKKVPAPKLVAASKHHGYETRTPKQSTPATSIATAINDKPLSEVLNTDKVRIKALEAELEEQGSRLETIEHELEAYKEERLEMDRELEAYRAESGYTKDLRERFRVLQAEYDDLKATKAIVPVPAGTSGDDPRLEWLETRNRELQLEVHLKEPLFQIGKDVRTRYLEEARSSQLRVARRDLDKASIERGNAAVWNGIAEADAAVLNGRFLSNGQLKNLVPVFNALYGDDPKEYYKLSSKMREAMDAYATIQTSAALNSNHPDLPVQELKIVEATVRLMGMKHNELGTEAFEEDVGGHAARALEKIKNAMVPCLKFDHKWDRMAVKEKLARDGNGSSTQSPEKAGPSNAK